MIVRGLGRLRQLRQRRLAHRNVFTEGSLSKFKSRKQAIRAHVDYPHDTDAEGQFDPGFRTYCRVADMIEEIPAETVVLDVGCNSGGLGRRLIPEKGCVMHGVDVNPALVERARAKGYTAHAAPAEQLPYEDGMFDVVVVSEIIEHVYDPRPVLAEAHRVLRPGGLVFGDVPTEQGRWGYETIDDHQFHSRVFTRSGLADLLGDGFEIDYLREVPGVGEEHPHFDVPTWYVFRCSKPA